MKNWGARAYFYCTGFVPTPLTPPAPLIFPTFQFPARETMTYYIGPKHVANTLEGSLKTLNKYSKYSHGDDLSVWISEFRVGGGGVNLALLEQLVARLNEGLARPCRLSIEENQLICSHGLVFSDTTFGTTRKRSRDARTDPSIAFDFTTATLSTFHSGEEMVYGLEEDAMVPVLKRVQGFMIGVVLTAVAVCTPGMSVTIFFGINKVIENLEGLFSTAMFLVNPEPHVWNLNCVTNTVEARKRAYPAVRRSPSTRTPTRPTPPADLGSISIGGGSLAFDGLDLMGGDSLSMGGLLGGGSTSFSSPSTFSSFDTPSTSSIAAAAAPSSSTSIFDEDLIDIFWREYVVEPEV
jgi:hypothetical protein